MALIYLDVTTNTWYMGRMATQKIPMEFMNFYNVVYIEKCSLWLILLSLPLRINAMRKEGKDLVALPFVLSRTEMGQTLHQALSSSKH